MTCSGLYCKSEISWPGGGRGENVSPREVKEFLCQHPKIAEVQVFGVPDPK
jgi:hypothetical protein